MSDLENSFLQQIARQPHDWLPRLIFADWLEEQGDPRGELIRLSHQLTRLDCEDRQPKEDRLQELSAAGVVWPSPPLPNGLHLPLILIPPGQFRMGSPPSEFLRAPDEDQVDVTLTRGFWLGQYAVTQAEYQALMRVDPHRYSMRFIETDPGSHPVEQVTWKQAMKFCQELTRQERAAGRLPAGWKYTLPTEAQWEYACRAATTTATAFGESLNSTQASFNGEFPYDGGLAGPKQKYTAAVGSYRPNAWNLYDMHGNVWEWCQDWYADKLPGGTNPAVRKTAEKRVSRGGCFYDSGHHCRSAIRSQSSPDSSHYSQGFRLALIQGR